MKIKKKIIEIENSINEIWSKSPFNKDMSLMGGISGVPIFYFMLYELEGNDRYLRKIEKIIELIFEDLNNTEVEIGSTFCSGIAGIGYMLNILEDTGKFENLQLGPNLEVIDEILLDTVDHFLSYIDDLKHKDKIQQIDFLHGISGIAYYLLDRINKGINKGINDNIIIVLFEKLSEIIIDDYNNALKVKNSICISEDLQETNLGLAHGHVSYILILSKFSNLYPSNEIIKNAIIASSKTILLFKNEKKMQSCMFPGIAVNKKTSIYNIRLGWCYGDQSISYGLYIAGITLNNKFLIRESKMIAEVTLERISVEKALLSRTEYDAGFCHGTTGVAYNHKKWFEITKNKMHENLYEKFINETLIIGEFENGLAGYLKYDGDGNLVKAIGLLDGITGIGVILIDRLLINKSLSKWPSIFLLN